MPETPEAHKEIIAIKREVQEIRQTQDAEIHHNRQKWEEYVFRLLQNRTDMMRVLLAIDGTKSAKDLEKECNLYQMKCWRLIDQLQREGVIYKLEETKKGSPIYAKSRWYIVLRLDEKVQKKLAALTSQPTETVISQTILGEGNVENQSQPENSVDQPSA